MPPSSISSPWTYSSCLGEHGRGPEGRGTRGTKTVASTTTFLLMSATQGKLERKKSYCGQRCAVQAHFLWNGVDQHAMAEPQGVRWNRELERFGCHRGSLTYVTSV